MVVPFDELQTSLVIFGRGFSSFSVAQPCPPPARLPTTATMLPGMAQNFFRTLSRTHAAPELTTMSDEEDFDDDEDHEEEEEDGDEDGDDSDDDGDGDSDEDDENEEDEDEEDGDGEGGSDGQGSGANTPADSTGDGGGGVTKGMGKFKLKPGESLAGLSAMLRSLGAGVGGDDDDVGKGDEDRATTPAALSSKEDWDALADMQSALQ